MELSRRKRGSRIFSCLIIFFAAAMVFFFLAGEVNAITGDNQEETTAPKMEEEMQPAPEPTQEETLPVVSQGDLAAAVDALATELDEITLMEHAVVLQNMRSNSAYIREDAIAAIQKCTRILSEKKLLEEQIIQVKHQINSSAGLEDAAKERYAQDINFLLSEIGQDPIGELVNCLEDITEDIVDSVNESALEEQLQLVLDVKKSVDSFSEIIDKLPLLSEADKKINVISESLTGNALNRKDSSQQAEYADQTITETVNQLWDLVQRKDDLKAAVKSYFTISVEKQQGLADSIQQLDKDIDTFLINAVVDGLGVSSSQQADLRTLAKTDAQVSQKFLLVYIALGVAVLSIVMSIVASVCTLCKPKEDSIDLSGMASREDAAALDNQNRHLKNKLKLLEEKVDQWNQSLEERINTLGERVAQAEKPQVITQEVPDPKKNDDDLPNSSPIYSQTRVDYLKLDYQSIFPANSVLYPDSNGDYVLFDDGTIAPREPLHAPLNQMNELKGWKACGMMFLFNPQVAEQEYDSDKDVLPEGFFTAGKVLRRAVVKKSAANYILQEKGSIRMIPLG